jgi:hypothetical protein
VEWAAEVLAAGVVSFLVRRPSQAVEDFTAAA